MQRRELTDEEVRTRLAQFAEELRELVEGEERDRKLRDFPPSISPELGKFIVKAIDRYLAGREPSMDHALGLRRRGRPAKPGKHRDLAIEVARRRFCGESWNKICDDLRFDDQRELQRICERYSEAVSKYFGQKAADRLNDGD